MSTTTPHLSLVKADPEELVNVVSQINQNYDKIDAETLDHDNRIETIEGFTGLSEWVAYEPAVMLGDVALNPGLVEAEFLKIGNLIFVSLEITNIPIANYDPYNFEVELPYQVFKGVSGQAIHTGTSTTDLGFERERVMSATRNQRNSGVLTVLTDKVMFYLHTEFSSSIQLVPQGSIEFTTVSSLSATFQYRTNNVPVA